MTVTKAQVRPGAYHDSVLLMQLQRSLVALPGVLDAGVVMGTEANKAILTQSGLLPSEARAAEADDLVIVVRAADETAAEEALGRVDELLASRRKGGDREYRPKSLESAVRMAPDARLALVSVPGRYAAGVAGEALRNGLHVFLFSDNVSIEDEVALKQYAARRGLLLMGPDCGTAIINGVALGFANAVPRGPVGIVAAAGTGLQEVSTLLARLGIGISHGIGTGGRDLSEAVGGVTMLEGLMALQADPQTEALVLISKPPSRVVARRVLDQVREGDKPTVVCFLGGDPAQIAAAGAVPARTLQEAAYLAAAEVEGYEGPSADEVIEREILDLEAQAAELRGRLKPDQKYLRGLFSGGTLASEALVIWEEMLEEVLSNVALAPRLKLKDATRSQGHCVVDLGTDEFTVGRPHPMIDNHLRVRRLMQEASDPQVAAIVLDVVLGYGAHPDPAAELGPAIHRARERAAGEGRELIVVASVTGTEGDPQGLSRQVRALEEAGAVVCSCNAAAARLVGFVVV